MKADPYLQRLATRAGLPARARAFFHYARELRESHLKAKVDLWLTTHNSGELLHWVDATHLCYKRRKCRTHGH